MNLVSRLNELPKPAVRIEAENECVYRLRQASGRLQRRRRSPLGFRLIWVTGILLSITLAAFAALHYSKNSLPGDRLYPVKRAGESVCLILERNALDRCEYRVRLAEARLGEFVACVGSGRRCNKVLSEMVRQSETALKELKRAGVADSSYIDKVGISCAYQAETLKNLYANIHNQDTTSVREIIGTCNKLYSQCCAGGSCGGCMKDRPCKTHRQPN